uniref:Fumarylacetoacetase n=2 Tax=Lygus hesperus TaxID=30085 RepID=A0A0A9VRL9_LYGHE
MSGRVPGVASGDVADDFARPYSDHIEVDSLRFVVMSGKNYFPVLQPDVALVVKFSEFSFNDRSAVGEDGHSISDVVKQHVQREVIIHTAHGLEEDGTIRAEHKSIEMR